MIALSLGSTLAIIIGLILLAMLLFLAEMLTPSFGLLSVAGAGALAVAVYFGWTIHKAFGIALIVGSVLAVPGYFMVMVRVLPRTTAGRKLFLNKEPEDTSGASNPNVETYDDYVGMTAKTETPLRPAGAIRVDGKRIHAVAESGMIERGAEVKIVRLSGSNLVVRPVR